MSPVNISGEERLLKKVLSDEFSFAIPIYQRPYGWTIDESSALLDDLLSFLGEEHESIADLSPYFLGSIVLIKKDSPDAEVVDGQQRLATLTILFSVLRMLTEPDFAEGLTFYIYRTGRQVEGTLNSYRMTLKKDDAEFFRKYIQEPGGLNTLETEQATLRRTTSDSQKNILENALYFLQRLRAIPEQSRQRLATFMATRCFLVVVSTPERESAYRIFSVLNDRGLPLTLPDILKADVLGNIAEESRRYEYAQKWEAEEATLGRDPFQNLFSHIRMIERRTKVRNALTEFNQYIRPADNPEAFVDNSLLPLANAYEDILTASYESDHNAEQINELLKWLGWIDNSDWIPPAILYIKLYRYQPDRLLQFLRDLERLAAGLMILRANINKRIERYGSLLNWIDKGEDLYSANSPLQLTSEERNEILEVLDGDIYNFDQIRKFILLRLDSALVDGGASYTQSIITVEHVLPQNPPEQSEWIKWFPEPQQREELTHKLGNLALLPRRTNAAARNFSFAEKKRRYFQRDRVPNFALTNQVLSRDVWTPEIVETRQRDLLSRLQSVWRL